MKSTRTNENNMNCTTQHEISSKSVLKTKRLLVVDEDYLSFGLTGEIITRVIENLGVSELKQIRRLAVPDVPIPAASSIEEEIMPNKNSIKNLLKLMSKGE